jgi:predicted ester cyclase
MAGSDLAFLYQSYLSCVNDRDLDRLGEFVDEDVEYNGQRIGITGYRKMLEENYRDIPDLRFSIQVLVAGASPSQAAWNSTARLPADFSAWTSMADESRFART